MPLPVHEQMVDVGKHCLVIDCGFTTFRCAHVLLSRLQAAAHRDVLERFNADMAALAAVELHPAARVDGRTRLLDLLPEARLRDWAANCTAAHAQFANKVMDSPVEQLRLWASNSSQAPPPRLRTIA